MTTDHPPHLERAEVLSLTLPDMFWQVMQRLDVKRPSTGPWALAVSGGSDSVALMQLAAKAAEEHGAPAPIVLTVDHGLRDAAASEAAQVASWASVLGLDHRTLTWTGEVPHADIQSTARDIRYRLMGAFCQEHNVPALLTAHTRDDQAETFLLRLARGSGVEGLAGMRDQGPVPVLDETFPVRLYRPLLDVTRAQLRVFLTEVGQAWIDDPSNEDAQFARVRMRKLMPLLEKEGLTVERLARTADHMRYAHDTLDECVQATRARHAIVHAAGYVSLNVGALRQGQRYVGQHVLADTLMRVSGSAYKPRFAALTRLYDAFSDAALFGQGRTLSGCRVVPVQVQRGQVTDVLVLREMRSLRARMRKQLSEVSLKVGEKIVWDNRFDIWFEGGHLGTHIEGDIQPLGSEGVKHMRHIVEGKTCDSAIFALPAAVRTTLPALWQGDQLVACACHGIVNADLFPRDLGKTTKMHAVFRAS